MEMLRQLREECELRLGERAFGPGVPNAGEKAMDWVIRRIDQMIEQKRVLVVGNQEAAMAYLQNRKLREPQDAVVLVANSSKVYQLRPEGFSRVVWVYGYNGRTFAGLRLEMARRGFMELPQEWAVNG